MSLLYFANAPRIYPTLLSFDVNPSVWLANRIISLPQGVRSRLAGGGYGHVGF